MYGIDYATPEEHGKLLREVELLRSEVGLKIIEIHNQAERISELEGALREFYEAHFTHYHDRTQENTQRLRDAISVAERLLRPAREEGVK